MVWFLTAPVRAYLKGKQVDRGKARVGRLLVRPVLQLADRDLRFRWNSPAGGRFDLHFREEIGRHVAVFGSFEPIEMETLIGNVESGMSAYDVGAHVGLFTVPLALKSGPTGKIVAFEPYQANVARLQEHLALNRLSNVQVLPLAAGSFDGTAELHVGKDSARPTMALTRRENSDGRIKVACRRLDSVWDATGRPPIAAVKIDVEGTEVAVLLGAIAMITTCHPLLLIETVDHIRELEQLLDPLGYRYSQPGGFMPWNFLFTATS